MRFALLLLVACHGSRPKDALDGFAALQERMCACRDAACGDAVDRRWLDFANRLGNVDCSDDELTASIRIGVHFERCYTSLQRGTPVPAY